MAARAARKGHRWPFFAIGGGAALVALFVLSRFEWQPFNIPSSAMEPTLEVGDYVYARHYNFIAPARGDVTVFRYPRAPSTYYVKRMIGLPGDKVQLRDGTLYINGVPVSRGRAGTYTEPLGGTSRELYTESLPNGVTYSVELDPERRPPPAKACDRPNENSNDLENTCPFIVPSDHYFMVGDNRDNSADSRLPDVGFVARDLLVGRVGLIWWSANPDRVGKIVR
jgi:signal peptidase I